MQFDITNVIIKRSHKHNKPRTGNTTLKLRNTQPTRHQPNVIWMLGKQRRCWNNINPFKPEFTIVIFILYKPRIGATILDL